MVAPDLSLFQASSMAKQRCRASSFLADGFLFVSGALSALLVVWAFWSFVNPVPVSAPNFSTPARTRASAVDGGDCGGSAASGGGGGGGNGFNLKEDAADRTFYDDPYLSYSIEKPLKNWDEKRRDWLERHPSFAAGAEERVLMVTGSQPTPCRNPIGDHLLLRLFKNKVDYCRIHGYDIFYNNVLLQPKMFTFWAKIPIVRAAMVAHPEVEWIWWVDSDAAFTDMDFKLPLHRYKDHNLIVHGWPDMIYQKKSWVGLNAGVFLIRNCQWSIDFMEVWASMGPQTPNYDKWGKTLKSAFKDKLFPESDDQSGLVYLLLHEKQTWGRKIYIESQFYFEGYWLEIVPRFDNITDIYMGIERRASKLRRRHAEKVSERYAALWEEYLVGSGVGRDSWRRPFVTHFTGCQPCSGDHNKDYEGENCWKGMQRALSFADNQVLRNYGYVHPDIEDPSTVVPLPFDFPA